MDNANDGGKLSNILSFARVFKQPLYRNSLFLMLGSVSFGVSGFFFWLLAARLYSQEQIGIASVIISLVVLLGTISLPGFDISIARFINDYSAKSRMVNSCISISALISLAVAAGSLFVLQLTGSTWFKSIESIYFLFLFILFTILDPVVILQRQGVFIGLRKSHYSFFQSLTSLASLISLPLLVGMGALGIVTSTGLSSIIALIIGFIFMSRAQIKPAFEIRWEEISRLLKFSLGNYFAKVLSFLPGQLLPLLVINMMGARSNAYFYIAWAISNLLMAVPTAVSFSLLAEGSNKPEGLNHFLKQSLQFSLPILLIITVIVMLTAKFILSLFGSGYIDTSFHLLMFLVVGNIPAAVVVLFVAAFRVRKQIKAVIMIYGGIAIITLLGSYLLVPSLGLEGIGISWVGANLFVAAILGTVIIRRGV